MVATGATDDDDEEEDDSNDPGNEGVIPSGGRKGASWVRERALSMWGLKSWETEVEGDKDKDGDDDDDDDDDEDDDSGRVKNEDEEEVERTEEGGELTGNEVELGSGGICDSECFGVTRGADSGAAATTATTTGAVSMA